VWPSCGKIMDAYLLLKSVTTSAVALTSAVSTSMVTLTAEAPPTATAHATAALETPTSRLIGAVVKWSYLSCCTRRPARRPVWR
jgi:hypothetical protein